MTLVVQLRAMTSILRYGAESALRLDLPSGVLIAECDGPRDEVIVDPSAAVASAIGAPIDFPPLEQAAAPGDRVVLAVESEIPQVADVVAPIIEALQRRGVEPTDITILRPQEEGNETAGDPRGALASDVASRIGLEFHDPDDTRKLSYLAATAEGRAVYLNRSLVDADLVVPIEGLQCRKSAGYHGPGGAIYPRYSNTETIQRFLARSLADGSETLGNRSQDEIAEVLWLLGICFTIQLVPGPGDSLLRVFAGSPESVGREGQISCDSAWEYKIPRRAALVVAAVEGHEPQQSWTNVGRALSAAARAVAHGGSIVVCCDVEAEPGPALRQIDADEDLAAISTRIRASRTEDSLPAAQLVEALDQARVYLLSRLDEDVVEDLGVAAVSKPEEIARLASRHESCILLASAQRAAPLVASE